MSNYSIPSDETEVPGMKVLYADRSEAGNIQYLHDVVYDVRSGIPLHLQMLYPEVPAALAEKRAEEQKRKERERIPDEKAKEEGEAGFGGKNPVPPSLRMPCIVYVQGSGWSKQDCYGSLPKLVDIARQGFVVASVEYRPAYVEPFPGFVSDVKAAIRFLRANSALYGIDPARIAVWGCSSGGHTALMVGATGWTREFDEGIYPEEDSSVCACVAYYGVSEFSPFLPGGKFARPFLFDMLLGKEEAKDAAHAARLSPVTYIQKEREYPPFLLIHGDEDAIVPFEQSVFMYRRLKECGKRVDFYEVRGAGHGRFFWTPEVFGVTKQFFKAYV